MKCPSCDSTERLYIKAEQTVKVYVDSDGNVEDSEPETGLEWSNESEAGCSDCGWVGTVEDTQDEGEGS